MAELQYRLLGRDEKSWQKKLFFSELGRRGNPDSAFMLLLASPRKRSDDVPADSLAVDIFSKMVGHYSRGHLTNSPREMVRQLVELVSAEGGRVRESKIDLAAGFLHVKGRQAAGGSVGRLRAGFANHERLVASSPLMNRGKGKRAEEQVSLDLGQTVESDLDELPAFFIAPSSATAVGPDPLRKFLWDFISDEAGLGDTPPAGWEHLPCLAGCVEGQARREHSDREYNVEPVRAVEHARPKLPRIPTVPRRVLYWIGGIAGAVVVAVTIGLFASRGPDVANESPQGGAVAETERAAAGAADKGDTEAAGRVSGEGPGDEGSSESGAGDIQSAVGSSPGLSLLWRKSLGGVLTSSPVDIGGAVAFGSRSGAVYCLSKSDGSERWRYKGPDGFGSSPAATEGKLFIGCYDGSIFCLDSRDGSEIWRYRTGGKVVCSPSAAAGGRILVGSFDGKLYCLSTSGEPLWESSAGAGIWASPVASEEAAFFGDLAGRIHCLDLASGRPRWRVDAGGKIYGSPVLGQGRVYFGSSNGKVAAHSAADGREVWKSTREGSVSSSLAMGEGALLVGFEDKTFVALAPDDGTVLWKTTLPGEVRSRPAVAAGTAAVTCYNGSALLIDISSGSVLAQFKTGGSVYATPLVDGGAIYFGDMKGDFVALSATGLPSE